MIAAPRQAHLGDSPFPGIRPYEERESDRFFGRNDEINELVRRIQNRVGVHILVADSGCGKTSLLNAGVVPRLRAHRESWPTDLGVTLVLREWGIARSSANAIACIWEGLRRAIEKLERSVNDDAIANQTKQLSQDVVKLSRVSSAAASRNQGPAPSLSDLIDFVNSLSEEVDGLVLVVDQLEELLGSGARKRDRAHEADVLGALGDVHQRCGDVSILLSLRSEYYERLTPLNPYVGSLLRRTYHLSPIPELTAKEVVIATCEAFGIPVDGESAKLVIDHTTDALGAEGRRRLEMLELQAVVAGLVRWCDASDIPRAISSDMLDLFIEALQAKFNADGQGSTTTAMLALEDMLEVAISEFARNHQLSALRRHRLRRALVAMGPPMSVGAGFKVAFEENDLAHRTIAADLRRLRLDEAGIDDQIKEARACRAARAHRAARRRDRPPLATSADDTKHTRALEPEERKRILITSALDAIDAAHAGDILKVTEIGGHRYCELNHDQFGPVFQYWASVMERRFEQTLGAVVKLSGEAFEWGDVDARAAGDADGLIRGVEWVGCSFFGTNFCGVSFSGANLKGSIFLGVEFKDVTFEDCDLAGAVFLGCRFDGVVTFRGTDLQSSLFGPLMPEKVGEGPVKAVEIEAMTIESLPPNGGKASVLDGVTMRGVVLNGTLSVTGASVRFAQIDRITAGRETKLRLDRCDLFHSQIFDYEETWVEKTGNAYGKSGNADDARVHAGALPPPFERGQAST